MRWKDRIRLASHALDWVFCCSLTRAYSISQPPAVHDFAINFLFPLVFPAADGTVFLYGHVVAVDLAANG